MVKEHDDFFGRFRMYTNPNEPLPQHQRLLLVDPAELGEGPLANKQVWIPNMDASRLAQEKVDEAVTRGADRTGLGQIVLWMEEQASRKNTSRSKKTTSCESSDK